MTKNSVKRKIVSDISDVVLGSIVPKSNDNYHGVFQKTNRAYIKRVSYLIFEQACKNNDLDTVSAIINSGLASWPHYDAGMRAAARYGYFELAKLLYVKEIDLTLKKHANSTLKINGIKNEAIITASQGCFNHGDINIKSSKGRKEIIEFIVSNGVKDFIFGEALNHAVASKGNEEMFRYILEKLKPTNQQTRFVNFNYISTFKIAVSHGNIYAIKALACEGGVREIFDIEKEAILTVVKNKINSLCFDGDYIGALANILDLFVVPQSIIDSIIQELRSEKEIFLISSKHIEVFDKFVEFFTKWKKGYILH